MYRCNGEDVKHLLIHCARASCLWSFAFRSFGVSWVLPKRVHDLFFGWRGWFGRRSSTIWNTVPLCVMWLIWKEHNNCIFEDVERSGSQLIALLEGTLFDWSCAWGLTSNDSILILNFLFVL